MNAENGVAPALLPVRVFHENRKCKRGRVRSTQI